MIVSRLNNISLDRRSLIDENIAWRMIDFLSVPVHPTCCRVVKMQKVIFFLNYYRLQYCFEKKETLIEKKTCNILFFFRNKKNRSIPYRSSDVR